MGRGPIASPCQSTISRQFGRVGRDGELRGPGPGPAADAQACVERDDPVVVGPQRIDVEFGQLGQIGQHLRQRDQHVADGVEIDRQGWSR